MKLAFIGIGKMGSGIAHNLLRAGHDLTVYNRTRAKAEAIEGAKVADSPAEACRDANAVMTMLADDHAVEETTFGKDGIAGALRTGCVHVSHSTISTALARRLATEHAARGQRYLSVPVFGRPEAAEAKKLVVVPAGDARTVEEMRPVFDAIGRATFIAGTEPWQANALKLCGNFMIASMLETFGEAFATMRKAGVDPQRFLEVMNTLFASPVYEGYGGAIVRGKFQPAGFALRLGLKDVRLALAAAEECESPMPIASLVHDRFLAALAQGQGDWDWSSVGLVAARDAGLKITT
jgi:3-hydroxyisobutyrate dehydrogenase-like beta-hydroxyacid dehydrogenase